MRPWVVLVFTVSLLLSCESQGPSAVTPVFVQKGGDVLLNVDADVPEEFSFVEWKFNKTVLLVKFPPGRQPKVFPGYTGRVEFPEKKYSVKLKNLKEADRGVYTAKVASAEEDDLTLAQYNVIVQDPVSPVKLIVISVDSRSSECNLTVICRTQDSHINSTFRCDNQTCSQEGGEQSEVTTSGASLRIYLSSSSIICTHSNQVSRTEDTEIIGHLCPLPYDPQKDDSNVPVIAIAVPVLLLILVIIAVLLGLFYCYRKKGNYNRENIENTVYEIPQVGTTAQPLDQNPDDASGLSPTSTYCLVGPHSGPQEPNKTRDTTLPESLYATVEKPAKSLKK